MNKILLLGTGGTIASADAGDGLTPGMDGADFLRYVPAIKDLCLCWTPDRTAVPR